MKSMKKLAALALAVIMAISCTVLAGAASETQPAATAQPAAATTSSSLDNDVSGTATGNGISEGSISDGVVSLSVPTSTNDNLYGMILDPRGLLKKTNYARFGTNAATTVEFQDEDGHLFFATKVDSGKTTYSAKSAALSITNKSYLPVDVSLEAAITVPTGISMGSADLSDVESGAGMYLAIETAETNNNNKSLGATVSSGTNLTVSNFASTDTALDDAVINVAYDGTAYEYTFGFDGNDYSIEVLDASDSPLYGGSAASANATIYNNADGAVAATFTVATDGAESADYTATITLSVPEAAEDEGGPAVVDAETKKATVFKTLVGNAAKYEETYKGTSNGVDKYEYQLKSGAADFPTIDFNMTGKINDDAAWDSIKPAAGDLKIELTWKVSKHTDGSTPPAASNAAPTANATTQSTRIGGTATVTYTLGSGASAATAVSKVSYTNANGAAADVPANNIVDDGNGTLTITTIAPVYNGSGWKVVFDNGAEVAVTLK